MGLIEAVKLDQRDGTVMVTVAVVGVVQVAVHQIVHVVAVRHGRVATIGAMLMRGIVPGAIVRGAIGRIGRADFQGALVVVPVMRTVEVSVVQIVDVVAVLHRRVAAAGAVGMVVLFVYVVAHRRFSVQGSSSGSSRAVGLAGVSLAWAKALKTISTMC